MCDPRIQNYYNWPHTAQEVAFEEDGKESSQGQNSVGWNVMVRRSQESQPSFAVLSEVADASSEFGARGKYKKECLEEQATLTKRDVF